MQPEVGDIIKFKKGKINYEGIVIPSPKKTRLSLNCLMGTILALRGTQLR